MRSAPMQPASSSAWCAHPGDCRRRALDGVQPDLLLPTHEFAANPDGTITVGEGP
jgi:hypothetical protein